MHSTIRLLTGVTLAGYAVYASFHQYPVEHVVFPLVVAVILLKDVRWIRAKAGPINFEARFGADDVAKDSDQRQSSARERLLDWTDKKRQNRSDSRSNEELEAPGD